MTDKSVLRRLVTDARDAGIDVDCGDDLRRMFHIHEQLSTIEFETLSSCGNVLVVMNAAGRIVDIVIAEGAVDRLSHARAAAALLTTIRRAEDTVVEVITALRKGRL